MLFTISQVISEGGGKGEAGMKEEENNLDRNVRKDLEDSEVLNKLRLLHTNNVILRLLLRSVPSQDVTALREMNWDIRKILLLVTATGLIINRKNGLNCDVNTNRCKDIIEDDSSIQSGENEREVINEFIKKPEMLFERPHQLEISSIFSIFLNGDGYFKILNGENSKVVLDPGKNIFSCLWWYSPDVWKYLISFL